MHHTDTLSVAKLSSQKGNALYYLQKAAAISEKYAILKRPDNISGSLTENKPIKDHLN